MILITVHTFKKGKNSQKLSVILKKLLIQSPFKFQPNICQSFYLIENLLISLIIYFIVCFYHMEVHVNCSHHIFSPEQKSRLMLI